MPAFIYVRRLQGLSRTGPKSGGSGDRTVGLSSLQCGEAASKTGNTGFYSRAPEARDQKPKTSERTIFKLCF